MNRRCRRPRCRPVAEHEAAEMVRTQLIFRAPPPRCPKCGAVLPRPTPRLWQWKTTKPGFLKPTCHAGHSRNTSHDRSARSSQERILPASCFRVPAEKAGLGRSNILTKIPGTGHFGTQWDFRTPPAASVWRSVNASAAGAYRTAGVRACARRFARSPVRNPSWRILFHAPRSAGGPCCAAGVAMALPMLEAMRPAWAGAPAGGRAAAAVPRRMVCVETNMGILPQFFFPEKAGRDYDAHALPGSGWRRMRDDLTVFSGVSHPGVTGGHAAEKCFLTGTPHPERGRLPQLDLARPVRRRAGRQPHPLPVAGAGHEQRGTRPSATPAAARRSRRSAAPASCSRSCSCRASRRRSPPTSRRCGRAAARSTSSATRPKRLNRSLSTGRPAADGPVLHVGARAGAAAAQRRGVGTPSPSRW